MADSGGGGARGESGRKEEGEKESKRGKLISAGFFSPMQVQHRPPPPFSLLACRLSSS
jgi:hypothetical protein